MENNYIIHINGYQQAFEETDNDNIELTTLGSYEYEDGLYYIEYDESEATGMEGTHTSVEIGADYVSLVRSGEMNTDMLFIKGKKTYSMYNTPFGQMLVGLYTLNMDINVYENSCSLEIEYEVELNDKPSGKNTIEIYVTEANKNE